MLNVQCEMTELHRSGIFVAEKPPSESLPAQAGQTDHIWPEQIDQFIILIERHIEWSI
jgi:hypothetical protein